VFVVPAAGTYSSLQTLFIIIIMSIIKQENNEWRIVKD